MDLGTRIKVTRSKKGISQSELGRRLGVAPSAVSHWEANRKTPEVKTLQKLSEVLDVSIAYLTGESDLPLNDKKTDYVHDLLNASNEEFRKKYVIDEVDGVPVTDKEIEYAREQIRLMRNMLNHMQTNHKDGTL